MLRRELLTKTLLSTLSLALFTKVFGKTALARSSACQPGATPEQTSGPFYPVDHLPHDIIDTDADLITREGHTKNAVGEIVLVIGSVKTQNCTPVAGALVEIWQACATGKYNHADDPNPAPLDPHFQYWGKAVTDANGFYRFRTIIPGAYPATDDWDRPPHIHFKVSCGGYAELITQMYFKNNPLNEHDLILQSLTKAEQNQLVVEFTNHKNQIYPVGEFNIHLEKTS